MAGLAAQSALFTSASFPNVGPFEYLVPTIGGTAGGPRPANVDTPVAVQLSDGRRIFVFDTLRTAMRCLEKMRQAKQNFLVASDDILVWAVSWTKLICAEATLSMQRLMSSYVGQYTYGFTRFVHRNLSAVTTLGEALQSVGFAMGGAALQTNDDLDQSAVHATVVDYRYPATTLDDSAQTEIRYNWREPLTRGSAPPVVVPAP